MLESLVKKKDGVEGFFTAEPDRRFDADLHVTMRLYTGGTGLSTASAEIDIKRSQELNEDASVADRERLFDTLTRDLMAQFDAQVCMVEVAAKAAFTCVSTWLAVSAAKRFFKFWA